MVPIWIGIGIGILSTIIVSVMGFFARATMAGMASNLLNIFSHERRIAGSWETTFTKTVGGTSLQNNETAELTQIGSRVYGTIVNTSKNPYRNYKMRGTLREGILVATYETIDSHGVLDRGAFTLKLNAEGDRMSGYYAWTDDDINLPSAD